MKYSKYHYYNRFGMGFLSIKTIKWTTLICMFIYIIAFSKIMATYKNESNRNCLRYIKLRNQTSDPLFCKRMHILFSRLCDEEIYDLRIIVIVFDRSDSLLRLLRSLNEAIYHGDKVKLEVWIDRSVQGYLDEDTVNTANEFSFKHGEYEIIHHAEHAGLFGQWLSTWRPGRNSSEIAVICEDDITVSKYFYTYLKLVHKKYDHYPKINGYALQGVSRKHHQKDTSPLLGPNGSIVFLYPVLGSWGFSPSRDNWIHFLEWFISACRNETIDLYIPDNIASKWYNVSKKKGKHDGLWTIWHMYHAYINFEFTLYTNLPGIVLTLYH